MHSNDDTECATVSKILFAMYDEKWGTAKISMHYSSTDAENSKDDSYF